MNWDNHPDPIVQAIGRRGYLDKPAEEIVALQVPKMLEELDEFSESIDCDCSNDNNRAEFYEHLTDGAYWARKLFDSGEAGTITDRTTNAIRELADMTVVLHILWAAMAEVVGYSLDADVIALVKACGDVERGKR